MSFKLFKEYMQNFPANAIFAKITGILKYCPWDKGGKLRPEWKAWVVSIVRQAKRDKQFVLFVCFSALWFREKAEKIIQNTTWWRGSIDASREYFYNDKKARRRQLLAIRFIISECRKTGVEFAISLGWESHTQPDSFVIPWAKYIIDQIGISVQVGINSYKESQIVKSRADFMVTEGGSYLAARERKGGVGNMEITHYVINSNPGYLWPPHNPGKFQNGTYETLEIYMLFRDWLERSIGAIGCGAVAFDRWVVEKIMLDDIKNKGVDISGYDFELMEKSLAWLYGKLLKASSDIDSLGLPPYLKGPEEAPEPEPEPPAKPEETPTEAVPVVEKEVKEMNWFNKILETCGSFLIRNWKITLPVFALVVILAFVFGGGWYALLFVFGVVFGATLKAGK